METFFVYLVFCFTFAPDLEITCDGYNQTLYQATQCPNCDALLISPRRVIFL